MSTDVKRMYQEALRNTYARERQGVVRMEAQVEDLQDQPDDCVLLTRHIETTRRQIVRIDAEMDDADAGGAGLCERWRLADPGCRAWMRIGAAKVFFTILLRGGASGGIDAERWIEEDGPMLRSELQAGSRRRGEGHVELRERGDGRVVVRRPARLMTKPRSTRRVPDERMIRSEGARG